MVQNLGTLDETNTIYAVEPWTTESKAVALPEPDNGTLPAKAKRLNATYFLEVFIACDLLKDFPTSSILEDKCVRLIRYAIDDA
ncbi:hypothetical protein [Aliidongia dinghuensis]|uniref:hypothetical protein n=1 Tax=Aliidongia dinghuensis TaxID=1867774 RepID=UPI0016651455|nr:hypothetical protein [Aliidongia dinghuensis]